MQCLNANSCLLKEKACPIFSTWLRKYGGRFPKIDMCANRNILTKFYYKFMKGQFHSF